METGSCWNKVTHDNILFEAAQDINLAQRRRIGEDTSRVLEGRCRYEAVRLKAGFGDA